MTSLARLANETGGRFTERTNDLTLGYARAERDLGCVYSVGFYLEGTENNRPRDVAVRVRRPGLRAIHPSKYLFRSRSAKRQSLLQAAWAAPEMFQSGILRAHAFPLRPSSKKSWDALLAVSFPMPLAESAGRNVRRDFGAVLHLGPEVVHRFSRQITLMPENAEVTSEPFITFLEQVELKPGRYKLTAVLADPLDPDPHAARVEIDVPEVPKRELFLVGPILGQPAGPNLVVTSRSGGERDLIGGANSFQPLLVQHLEEAVDLVALTQTCLVSSKRRDRQRLLSGAQIRRALRDSRGPALGNLDPVDLTLERGGPIECQNLLDVVPSASLPDGQYVFEASLGAGPDEADVRERIRFAIGSLEGPPGVN